MNAKINQREVFHIKHTINGTTGISHYGRSTAQSGAKSDGGGGRETSMEGTEAAHGPIWIFNRLIHLPFVIQ